VIFCPKEHNELLRSQPTAGTRARAGLPSAVGHARVQLAMAKHSVTSSSTDLSPVELQDKVAEGGAEVVRLLRLSITGATKSETKFVDWAVYVTVLEMRSNMEAIQGLFQGGKRGFEVRMLRKGVHAAAVKLAAGGDIDTTGLSEAQQQSVVTWGNLSWEAFQSEGVVQLAIMNCKANFIRGRARTPNPPEKKKALQELIRKLLTPN